ncbi:MAG: hypothetical protein HKN12_00195, partial [Gemmatimonadetes bacterium]|nr:hypothetical protein [Gemmatimonadota bacterium]
STDIDVGREFLCGTVYAAFASEEPDPYEDRYSVYIRDQRWKYIRNLATIDEGQNENRLRIVAIETEFPNREPKGEELYDLWSDPAETTDLLTVPAAWADPAAAVDRTEQRKRLADALETCLDDVSPQSQASARMRAGFSLGD